MTDYKLVINDQEEGVPYQQEVNNRSSICNCKKRVNKDVVIDELNTYQYRNYNFCSFGEQFTFACKRCNYAYRVETEKVNYNKKWNIFKDLVLFTIFMFVFYTIASGLWSLVYTYDFVDYYYLDLYLNGILVSHGVLMILYSIFSCYRPSGGCCFVFICFGDSDPCEGPICIILCFFMFLLSSILIYADFLTQIFLKHDCKSVRVVNIKNI